MSSVLRDNSASFAHFGYISLSCLLMSVHMVSYCSRSRPGLRTIAACATVARSPPYSNGIGQYTEQYTGHSNRGE